MVRFSIYFDAIYFPSLLYIFLHCKKWSSGGLFWLVLWPWSMLLFLFIFRSLTVLFEPRFPLLGIHWMLYLAPTQAMSLWITISLASCCCCCCFMPITKHKSSFLVVLQWLMQQKQSMERILKWRKERKKQTLNYGDGPCSRQMVVVVLP